MSKRDPKWLVIQDVIRRSTRPTVPALAMYGVAPRMKVKKNVVSSRKLLRSSESGVNVLRKRLDEMQEKNILQERDIKRLSETVVRLQARISDLEKGHYSLDKENVRNPVVPHHIQPFAPAVARVPWTLLEQYRRLAREKARSQGKSVYDMEITPQVFAEFTREIRGHSFPSNHFSMALPPVSVESLASIPWMSSKRIAHCVRDVSLRGPNSEEVWQRLIGRVDMVAHTLSPKQGALVLNALARTQPKIEDVPRFLQRFSVRFLPNILEHANVIDGAQILHAARELGIKSIKTDPILGKIISGISAVDAPTLALILRGVSPLLSSSEDDVCSVLLKRAGELLAVEELNEQLLAQTLMFATEHRVSGVARLVPALVGRIPSISLRSFVLVCSTLARDQNPEIFAAVSERVMSDNSVAVGASLKQLGVVLRSLQKMGTMGVNSDVCYKVVEYMRMRRPINCDTHTLGIVLAGLSRIEGSEDLIDHLCGNNVEGAIRKSDLLSITASVNRIGQGRIPSVDRLREQLLVNR